MCLVHHFTWLCQKGVSVRNTGIISDYMHILNFLFNISILPFQTDVLLLFSAEDMSRNVTLKILSEYLLDKC
jgi:hypothetical protein